METTLLSDLPENIIYRILCSVSKELLSKRSSRVPKQLFVLTNNPDAIRLSCVSKQMFELVQKRPNLIFHYDFIRPRRPRKDIDKARYVKNYRQEFDYILRTLERYHGENIPLESFTLESGWIESCSIFYEEDIYKRCIELAVRNGVRKLHLLMDRGVRDPAYVAPHSVLEAESLVELKMSYCWLNPEGIVSWPNLKRIRLSLRSVADDKVFDNITRGCPSLENMTVYSYGFPNKNFHVANLRNLKKLKMNLRSDQCLVVNARAAPNLESVVCVSGHVDLGTDKYPNLTALKLHCEGISDHFFTNFARKFPVLEKLSFYCSRGLQRINLSSTSLKEIKLKVMTVTLQEACFNLPSLVRFDYSLWSWRGSVRENGKILPKLWFAGNSGGWSSRIILNESKRNIGAPWFMELNKFLAALNGSETKIKVSFEGDEQVLFNEDHRTIANSVIPVQGILEFFMADKKYWSGFSSSAASAILDCILLICQPRTITFEYERFFNYRKSCEIPKLLYEGLISRSSLDHYGVTSFEMSYVLYGKRSQSSTRFKAWDKLLKVLKAIEHKNKFKNDENKNKVEDICFHLEYCSENVQTR